MHFILPVSEFVVALAIFFLLSCKDSWATICLKIAGCILLVHIGLSHFYAQITTHRIYFAYYAGLAAGMAIGIFLVLLAARQIGKPRSTPPSDLMLN